MCCNKLLYKLFYYRHEERLLRCENYKNLTLLDWKKQTKLNWKEVNNFLNNLHIFDSEKIQEVLKNIVENNEEIFKRSNLYITSFGSEGKSGGKISYEFRHSKLVSEKKFIESWNLSDLPKGSTVIFVEDLIGTGSQSTEYIRDKLNLILNPSFDSYLLTICATPQGIEKVKNETAFNIINGILLEEKKYQNFSEDCNNFSEKEKKKFKNLNNKLTSKHKSSYDLGLLITFMYSPPNNSMPILWKDGYLYDDNKQWIALIPRKK